MTSVADRSVAGDPYLQSLSSRGSWLQHSWKPGIVLLALAFSLPVLTIASFIFRPSSEIWQHLLDNLLAEYLLNSALLMLGVGFGTLIIGISCAWLTSVCEFPGKRLFTWALLLPMAFPGYIIAYTYTGMFDFAGPVQSWIRELTGWHFGDYYFPEIRSLGGAICMLSLVLYPYVYLLSRAAFSNNRFACWKSAERWGARSGRASTGWRYRWRGRPSSPACRS